MTEFPRAFAETASQLVKGEAIHVAFSRDAGGSYSIFVSSEKSVVRDLCVTAVTLYGIYTTSKLMARAIEGVVYRWLEGQRKDQKVGETKPGSLHVKLHCFTDERFLEVWSDFKSGRMKDRLQEEFSQVGIDVEGLKIEMENMEEVNETMRAIESRQKSPDLKNEGNMKSSGHKMEEMVKDMSRKLNEIRENQERVEYNIETSFKNLKREIIDEIRASTTSQKSSKPSLSTCTPAEVIVIGGNTGTTNLTSVEKFQLGQHSATWVPLPSINNPRSLAASAVIDEKILVVGGNTETIEELDVSQRPLQWMISEAVLPFSLFGHSCVAYDRKLIVIGGYNSSTGEYSNEVHEVHLVEPYSTNLLCTLPKPICYHGTEIINDKIYIFGGKGKEKIPCDDILVFDPVTNECKKISNLPYPLRYMLTAQWENKVILLGGARGDGIALKEVIMFDPMSKKCSKLPSMNHARKGAAAVVTGDVIVVAGGRGDNKPVNSVECFDLRNKTWNELPPMKEARAHATAVCV